MMPKIINVLGNGCMCEDGTFLRAMFDSWLVYQVRYGWINFVAEMSRVDVRRGYPMLRNPKLLERS